MSKNKTLAAIRELFRQARGMKRGDPALARWLTDVNLMLCPVNMSGADGVLFHNGQGSQDRLGGEVGADKLKVRRPCRVADGVALGDVISRYPNAVGSQVADSFLEDPERAPQRWRKYGLLFLGTHFLVGEKPAVTVLRWNKQDKVWVANWLFLEEEMDPMDMVVCVPPRFLR